MSTAKLKPCPFCGKRASWEDGSEAEAERLYRRRVRFAIRCNACPLNMNSRNDESPEELFLRWNRRAKA